MSDVRLLNNNDIIGKEYLNQRAVTVRENYMVRLGYCPIMFKDEALQNELDRKSPRSPFVRYFKNSKLEEDYIPSTAFLAPGSTSSSIFNLCSATLGAGALSLPHAFMLMGFIPGSLVLFLAAIITVYSINLLIYCREKTGLNSYEDLSLYCFGRRVAVLVEVCIALFCFGTCVAYIIAAGDILHGVLKLVIPGTFSDKWFIIVVLTSVIMFPLSLYENVSALSFPSFLGVISIIYLVLAVSSVSLLNCFTNGCPITSEMLFNPTLGIIEGIPIVMFAFTCQVNVFSIYTELQRPTIRRMDKIAKTSSFIDFMCYALVGILGYIEFDSDTDADILSNFLFKNIPITIAKLSVVLTVLVAFPLNVFPCRFALEIMLIPNKHKDSRVAFLVLTTAIVFSSMLIAILVPSIDVVFSLLGSTTSSLVCFILPGAFLLKIEEGKWYSRKKLPAWIIVIVGVLLGIFSTGLSIYSLIK